MNTIGTIEPVHSMELNRNFSHRNFHSLLYTFAGLVVARCEWIKCKLLTTPSAAIHDRTIWGSQMNMYVRFWTAIRQCSLCWMGCSFLVNCLAEGSNWTNMRDLLRGIIDLSHVTFHYFQWNLVLEELLFQRSLYLNCLTVKVINKSWFLF